MSYQPPLGPAVLEPGFHLRICHFQTLGQSCAFGAGQILLPVETLLQLTNLDPGEGGARLFPFGRRTVLVRVSYPPRYGERYQGGCGEESTETPVSGRRYYFTFWGNKAPYIESMVPV